MESGSNTQGDGQDDIQKGQIQIKDFHKIQSREEGHPDKQLKISQGTLSDHPQEEMEQNQSGKEANREADLWGETHDGPTSNSVLKSGV